MDNPLVDFGSDVYQPNEPINCVYDTWGVPAAMIRGLFEYLYQADGLTILPHIPPGITRLEQRFPIRFGQKRLYLATGGSGPVTGVTVNGQPWKEFDAAVGLAALRQDAGRGGDPDRPRRRQGGGRSCRASEYPGHRRGTVADGLPKSPESAAVAAVAGTCRGLAGFPRAARRRRPGRDLRSRTRETGRGISWLPP